MALSTRSCTRSLIVGAGMVLASGCATQDAEFPELTGDYLGQAPPGVEPQLFAPGIVSTGMYVRDVAVTPDGNEFYFGASLGNFTVIMRAVRVDGVWTKPEVAPFASKTPPTSATSRISRPTGSGSSSSPTDRGTAAPCPTISAAAG